MWTKFGPESGLFIHTLNTLCFNWNYLYSILDELNPLTNQSFRYIYCDYLKNKIWKTFTFKWLSWFYDASLFVAPMFFRLVKPYKISTKQYKQYSPKHASSLTRSSWTESLNKINVDICPFKLVGIPHASFWCPITTFSGKNLSPLVMGLCGVVGGWIM